MSKQHQQHQDSHQAGSPKNHPASQAPNHAAKPGDATDHNAIAQAKGLERQVAELTEALQRERADATNLRRRHEDDLAGLRNRTKANVVRELLPVADNLERALKHVPQDLQGNDYVKGVQGVVKQFEKTLQAMGVERIKTTGEPFDPRFHEAVAMEEGDGNDEVVAEELQAGYRLGDEVIRHAMVKVRA